MSKKFVRVFVMFSIGVCVTLLAFIIIANIYASKRDNTTNDIITPLSTSMQGPALKFYTLCGCSHGEEGGTIETVEGYCPDHFLVKLIDGYIYVYRSDNTEKPVKIYETDSSALSEADKKQLKDFIFFRTRDDMLMFLEGITI